MEKSKKVEKIKKGMFMRIIEKITWSFDNSSSGFSARKLSAFWSVMVATLVTLYVTIYDKTASMIPVYFAGIWLLYSLLCLGIVTAEQVLRFKEGFSNNKNDEDDHDHNIESEPIVEQKPVEQKPVEQKDDKKDQQGQDSGEDPVI